MACKQNPLTAFPVALMKIQSLRFWIGPPFLFKKLPEGEISGDFFDERYRVDADFANIPASYEFSGFRKNETTGKSQSDEYKKRPENVNKISENHPARDVKEAVKRQSDSKDVSGDEGKDFQPSPIRIQLKDLEERLGYVLERIFFFELDETAEM